ncbi:BamA/TamA family outer membrane protein [Bacteroidales bacterium AH-315-I05]|nr:BamA/TamA family outer membrane protein [Bacteroidales bacterium AH-315-I05]
MKGNVFHTIVFSSLIILSCNPAKHITEGEHLLVRSEIKFVKEHKAQRKKEKEQLKQKIAEVKAEAKKKMAEEDDKFKRKKIKTRTKVEVSKLKRKPKKPDEEELAAIIKQKPNRKTLGMFRFHLRMYNFGRNDTSGVRHWFKEVAGEEPFLLNDELTQKSTRQLKLFLKNKGYFKSAVTDTTVFNGKKAEVYYHVETGIPYRIGKITFSITDEKIFKPLKRANRKTLIKAGSNYDVDMFQNERERLAKEMQNQGYYEFSKEYVYFEMDSALNDYKVEAKEIIKNPVRKTKINGKDTLVESKHEIWFINDVYINTNYDPKNLVKPQGFTLNHKEFHFVDAADMQFRPDVLLKAIFIKKGDIYRGRHITYTHNRLAALKTFKFININFKKTDDGSGKNLLDCFIDLTPTPKQSLTFETEGTNKSGNLGIAGNLVYRNNNSFKGAEVFQFKLSGGIEAQQTLAVDVENEPVFATEDIRYNPFNTLEFGGEMGLFIPRFWLPSRKKFFPRLMRPKTDISTSYNFQKRPDFTRNIASIAYHYSWNTSRFHGHAFTPVDVSTVKIEKSKAFQDTLDELNNPFLANSYTDHLILSGRYYYTFNNQDLNKPFKNHEYFRAGIEGAGNTFRGIHQLTKAEKDPTTGSYTIGGIPYSQYIKADADLRLYKIINKWSKMVYRLYAGVGVPLANFNVLPFEKSFFAGGSNDIRGWTARTLGPGSYFDASSSTVDKIGDIKLQGNMEYRFDVFKLLKGAAFVDLGNIWLIEKDDGRTGGEFDLNRFYNEIAVAAGLGMRLDVSFFIIRLDMGVPMRDPSLPTGERWIFEKKPTHNAYLQSIDESKYKPSPVWNLGIGYPF